MNTIIIIVIIVIILIVMVSVYFYYRTKYSKYLYIERQDSNKPYKILDENIIKPLDGYNYSMGFFIYLNDYTENFKYWRHLLHKGNELRSTDVLDYTNWDELIQDIPHQSPGIWMNPQTTMVRLSFAIEISKNNCDLHDTESDCDYHSNLCKWNGNCILKDEHATNMSESISINNIDIVYDVDYVDIEIPYKKMTHIAFVLENKILNVYFNGKLRKIHKFRGEPIINNNNMFFNQPNSYNGSLFNFNYIPYEIDNEHVEELAKDIPNVSYIPKDTRFYNYIKRFKLKDAIQSFFI
jgi:hypothetical protein